MSGGVVLIAMFTVAGLVVAGAGVRVGRVAEDEPPTGGAGRRTAIVLVVVGAFLLAVAAVLVLVLALLHTGDPSFYDEFE